MTYISIDTKTKQAKKFVELIETLPFAKIYKEPNSITKKAFKEIQDGKIIKADSIISLLEKLKQ
ncbi:MAG: hypothetical protein M3R50_05880 [Bacteroidota bacterium]|nr:hypothetical protein [Bacteroidota bacterium]